MLHLWFLTVDLIYIHFVPFVTSIPWCKAFFPWPCTTHQNDLWTRLWMKFISWNISRSSAMTGTYTQAGMHWLHKEREAMRKYLLLVPSNGIYTSPFPPSFHLALCLWDQSVKISGDWFGEERRAISGNPLSWLSPGNCLWLCPLPGPLKSIDSLGF